MCLLARGDHPTKQDDLPGLGGQARDIGKSIPFLPGTEFRFVGLPLRSSGLGLHVKNVIVDAECDVCMLFLSQQTIRRSGAASARCLLPKASFR